MPNGSSSPVPTRWPRSCPGRTSTRCSRLRISSVSPGRVTPCTICSCQARRWRSSRCRRWRSRRVTAGSGSAAARRSGTWCPTASSSTSPNTVCTRESRDPSVGRRASSAPGDEFALESRIDAGRNMTATDNALTLARVAAQAAADKLAKDILLVDVSDRLAITDVFVIVTGANERQVGAIVDSVEEKMRAAGTKPPRREGERDGRWVLLDFVDVIVHVQHAEERVFYALDRLWKDCPTVAFVDAAAPVADGADHTEAPAPAENAVPADAVLSGDAGRPTEPAD